MAKQRGIHQISGTVNNLTYYEQKYVRGGLIRRVNDGMSGRLKTDPAFANTREKNAIFGMCSKIAASVWSQVPSASLNAKRPSVHARTTRFLYQYFAQQNFVLGDTPVFDSRFTRAFTDFLNSQIRNKITDFEPYIKTYEENISSSGTYNIKLNAGVMLNILRKLNTEYVSISGRRDASLSAPLFDPTQNKYLTPEVLEEVRQPNIIFDAGDVDVTLELPISRELSGFKFWCIQICPMNEINDIPTPNFTRSISLFIGYIA